MQLSRILAAGALAFFLVAPSVSAAAEVLLDPTGRGWINTLHGNGTSATNNYLVGNCNALSCTEPGEYRDFFTFAVPVLGENVMSAILRLDSSQVRADQAASFVYQITATSGVTFASLGTGQIFGQETYTAADNLQIRDIVLNADALAAITAARGGTLTISGRVLPPIQFGSSPLNALAFSDSGSKLVQLALTTSAVPEPSSWAMMIIGFVGAGTALRRRSVRHAA